MLFVKESSNKIFFLLILAAAIFFIPQKSFAAAKKCLNISSGQLVDVKGKTLKKGADEWGYDYQAHVFEGFRENYFRPEAIAAGGDELKIKWNEAWLSQTSCDGNKLLDRHADFDRFAGSEAELSLEASGN